MPENDPLELTRIDQLFKSFNQPIWVVTTAANDVRSGLTATWIHQASIDAENPTALVGLAPNHFTCETLLQSKVCVIHLMCNHQAETVYAFAKPSSRDHDKFVDVEFDEVDCTTPSGQTAKVPYLTDCHTALRCDVVRSFDAGDRIYFLCQVSSLLKESSGPFMRESDFFSSCTTEQIETLKTDLQSDVRIQRPLLNTWVKNLEKE